MVARSIDSLCFYALYNPRTEKYLIGEEARGCYEVSEVSLDKLLSSKERWNGLEASRENALSFLDSQFPEECDEDYRIVLIAIQSIILSPTNAG